MALLSAISVLLGLALVFFALTDVVFTVLHTQRESSISTRVHRAGWWVIRWLADRRRDQMRHSVLAWGMPALIILTLLVWSTVLAIGFALVYAPFIHTAEFFRAQAPLSAWPLADALYFSGVTFLTLGYGDLTPIHLALRMVAILQAGSGFLVLSLAVTYLLSVYPLIWRKVALAVSLNHQTAGRADGCAMAQRYLLVDRFDALADTLRALNDELLALVQAHAAYPILYFVRPPNVHESFVRVLALTQGIIGTFRYSVDPVSYPRVVNDPRLLLLEEGLLYTLHSLMHSSHLRIQDVKSDRWRVDFRDQRTELERRGITPVAAEPDYEEAFLRFREATDPYIRAYAHNVDFRDEDIWAIYGRWDRDSALLPRDPDDE